MNNPFSAKQKYNIRPCVNVDKEQESFLSDESLIEKAINGDREAFDQLYGRNRDKIYTSCLALTKGDESLANDICQETFISAYQKLHQLNNKSSFLFWLKEISKNKFISIKNKENKHNNFLREYIAVSNVHSHGDRAWSAEELQLVEDLIINMVDAKFKRTVHLHYLDGKTAKEISEIQGISISTVTTRLYKFREKFRGQIIRRVLKLRALQNDLSNT